MRELETGCGGAADRTEPSEDDDDAEEEMEEEAGGGDLDGLLEADQGAVRRAGWLYFKPLITVSKDRKLELVARRKWRRYWVTLKGDSFISLRPRR